MSGESIDLRFRKSVAEEGLPLQQAQKIIETKPSVARLSRPQVLFDVAHGGPRHLAHHANNLLKHLLKDYIALGGRGMGAEQKILCVSE